MSIHCMLFVEIQPEDTGKVVKPNKQLIYAKGLRFENLGDGRQIAEEEIDNFPGVLLNKKYIGIYDHWDGYPLDIGDTLLECFNSYEDALNLMLYGSESTIVDSIRPHTLRGTVYKGEDDAPPLLVEEIPADLAYSYWSDFVYLFTNGTWMYANAFSENDGKYDWYALEEDLMLANMHQLIIQSKPNQSDYVGSILVRGKKANVRHFLANACKLTELNNGRNRWYPVNGTKQAFIRPIKDYDLTDAEDDIIALFLYKQNYGIHADSLVKLSASYNIDFRLFACDNGMIICRNVEVTGGNIIKNEYFMPEDNESEDEDSEPNWPIISFGDSALQKSRAYRGKCELSSEIPDKKAKLLQALAEEQEKHYIPKCPCCGKSEMFTYDGKTDGCPSWYAGVYICDYCGCKESEEHIPPLSKWAVFKKENSHVFYPEAKNNGSGEI